GAARVARCGPDRRGDRASADRAVPRSACCGRRGPGMTAIAAPVMARLPAKWETRAADPGLVDLDGFVALVAPAGTPWLPNAIVLDPGPTVVWAPPLPALAPGPALARRGRAVLAALGEPDDSALRPAADAIEALRGGDMGAAVAGLLGRGAGLTPE